MEKSQTTLAPKYIPSSERQPNLGEVQKKSIEVMLQHLLRREDVVLKKADLLVPGLSYGFESTDPESVPVTIGAIEQENVVEVYFCMPASEDAQEDEDFMLREFEGAIFLFSREPIEITSREEAQGACHDIIMGNIDAEERAILSAPYIENITKRYPSMNKARAEINITDRMRKSRYEIIAQMKHTAVLIGAAIGIALMATGAVDVATDKLTERTITLKDDSDAARMVMRAEKGMQEILKARKSSVASKAVVDIPMGGLAGGALGFLVGTALGNRAARRREDELREEQKNAIEELHLR